MPLQHTVEQGEYLAKIAAQYGFVDYHAIWDHPQNSALKKKRQNPNVLYPGDRLYIPDKQQKTEQRGTGQAHKFQVPSDKVKLRIVLQERFSDPVANAQVVLKLGSNTYRLTTDAKGQFEQEVPMAEQSGTLVIVDENTPLSRDSIAIRIGHLDPVEEVSGQLARLANLGYYRGPLDKPDADALLAAVEEFQCDHMGVAAVDGICGPKTQAKLVDVHGS